MMGTLEQATELVTRELGDNVLELTTFRGETTISLKAKAITMAAKLLRDDPALNFNFLAMLTAVDYYPQEPRFIVAYRLYSLPNNLYLGLQVPVSGKQPELPSIESVYPSANWHEREVWDMFGINFVGSHDQRRILMPHDWEGHPLRKDYPLGYEEVQFTFNFDEIDKRKPYAKE
jgi:NADH-quinone oxidoreductase subunit C